MTSGASNSGVIENQLNLALSVSPDTRNKTLDLNVGYHPATKTWELIVKYNGSLERIAKELNIPIVILSYGYAILVIPEDQISRLASYVEIEFIEKPKHLFYQNDEGRAASCINPVQMGTYSLSGAGVLVGVIDSGVDYSHPDFRNEDGTTRIALMWDQTVTGTPPAGYSMGTLYTRDQINNALKTPMPQRMDIVQTTDLSGHGTHVTGTAAGNGRASNGVQHGVAPRSELIIVKLGTSVGASFPSTVQLMEAFDFVIKSAIQLEKPVAINVSFGNNYGAHTGRSILEAYINDVADTGRTSIVVGTGNEGATGNHAAGILQMGRTEAVSLAVNENEFTLNLQIWKNYYDHFDITIIAPNGTRVGPIPRILGTQQFRIAETTIFLYYGDPTPYNPQQEIYIEFIPIGNYINAGMWRFELVPRRIIVGNYDMWLPSGGVKAPETRFLSPSEFTTLTIPSTAYRAITVGAYSSFDQSYAPFSGRGFTRDNQVKPDLVAPGVNITSCAPGGGYATMSGTSMATPFVTGSAALLMEWGIVKGNDPYMYGEKIKATIVDGCTPLRVESTYPNRTLGYGALCLENSLNRIV